MKIYVLKNIYIFFPSYSNLFSSIVNSYLIYYGWIFQILPYKSYHLQLHCIFMKSTHEIIYLFLHMGFEVYNFIYKLNIINMVKLLNTERLKGIYFNGIRGLQMLYVIMISPQRHREDLLESLHSLWSICYVYAFSFLLIHNQR